MKELLERDIENFTERPDTKQYVVMLFYFTRSELCALWGVHFFKKVFYVTESLGLMAMEGTKMIHTLCLGLAIEIRHGRRFTAIKNCWSLMCHPIGHWTVMEHFKYGFGFWRGLSSFCNTLCSEQKSITCVVVTWHHSILITLVLNECTSGNIRERVSRTITLGLLLQCQ